MTDLRVPLKRSEGRAQWQNPCDTKHLLSLLVIRDNYIEIARCKLQNILCESPLTSRLRAGSCDGHSCFQICQPLNPSQTRVQVLNLQAQLQPPSRRKAPRWSNFNARSAVTLPGKLARPVVPREQWSCASGILYRCDASSSDRQCTFAEQKLSSEIFGNLCLHLRHFGDVFGNEHR